MNAERFTLDTNILVYSIDTAAGGRQRLAQEIIALAVERDCVLTLQAVSECYAAVTRKGRMPAVDAAAQASDFLDLFGCLAGSASAVRIALGIAASGRASYRDGLLLATACEGGCRTILTEDMADGTIMAGVRIVHPFGADGLSAAATALLAPLPVK